MTPLATTPLSTLLENLGSRNPTPGGGAVAGIVGALAASTASMVVSYSVGKKSLAEHRETLEVSGERLRRAREMFLELADEDAAAYSFLSSLYAKPQTDPERVGAVEAAIAVPLTVAATASDLARLIETLQPITNPHLASDLAISAHLTATTIDAGGWNVRANVPQLPNSVRGEQLLRELDRIASDAIARCRRVEHACLERLGEPTSSSSQPVSDQ